MEKYLHCIRHGYALHNKLYFDIGRKAYSEYRDTPLLEEGFKQAKELNKTWGNLNNIDLVVVSPCTRTLDTAMFVFQDKNIPMISKDFLIEYPWGGDEICNKRKDKKDLQLLYPRVQFDMDDNVLPWSQNMETIEQLEKRIEKLLYWIGQRKERNIAIVSHSSFIGQMKDKVIGDEYNELKHCFPYEIVANYDKGCNFVSLKMQ